MAKELVIFGIGDFARMAHFYFTHDSDYNVAAFTLSKEFIEDDYYMGLPVVPFEEVLERYAPADYDMFVAIGYSNVNQERARVYNEAKSKGYTLPSYVSTKATVWTKDIGDNTFIFEDNTVQPYTKIGSNVVLWSGNHIGHDAVIEDHCFITSHVVLSGRTHVGKYSFMGVNATVRDQVKIAEKNVIGAGALIIKDTEECGVYVLSAKGKLAKKIDQLEGI